MEISQRNSLYRYLKQIKVSFLFFFFFYKTRTGRQNRFCLAGWYQLVGEDIRKGCRRVNTVEMLYAHVCKLFQEWGWRIKENDQADEFDYDIL
jgi:hypothetical protein